jgi:hypothetical protein
MIKRIIFSIHILLCVCGNAYANVVVEPVMIVRFKNPDTNYHNYLKILLKQAKNQQINFKIISLYPKNSDTSMQHAAFKAHKMLNDMVDQGVSLDKISINYQENTQTDYFELYLYATL